MILEFPRKGTNLSHPTPTIVFVAVTGLQSKPLALYFILLETNLIMSAQMSSVP